MTFLQDFLSLIAGTITIFFLEDRPVLTAIFVGGLILSGLCWWLCSFYTHLWNKRYKVRLTHHLLCGLAAVITLVSTVVFATLRHASSAADVSIEAWKLQLGLDPFWADHTFKQAYERVRALGLEDFSNAPPPPVGHTIPATKEPSQVECAWIYASQAALYFKQQRPYLGSIVGASGEVPRNVLTADIRHYFATVGNTYPTANAISLVSSEVKKELTAKLPRVVTVLRIQLVLLFLVAQAFPFGLVGWAAYRDLKIHT
ncbi:MAG: hypothetical protein ABI600_08880 [Luteolibacter sp.]